MFILSRSHTVYVFRDNNIAAMWQNHYVKFPGEVTKDTCYKSNVLKAIKHLPKKCDVKIYIGCTRSY